MKLSRFLTIALTLALVLGGAGPDRQEAGVAREQAEQPPADEGDGEQHADELEQSGPQ